MILQLYTRVFGQCPILIQACTCRDGTFKSKMGMAPQHLTPSLHLANYVLHFCMQWRVVEGSEVGSAGCVVHVDMHRE